MSKKKILLLGNIQSIYITQYIENVLEPLGFEVYMLSNFPYDDSKILHFLTKHNIQIIKTFKDKENKLFTIPIFGSIIRKFLNFQRLKSTKFDVIHIQYVSKSALLLSLLLKKKTKLIASFWGSDLLRQPIKYLKSEEKFLNKFDYVSSDSFLLKDRYDAVYPKVKKDMNIVYYGSSLFEYIDKYDANVDLCKDFFCLPKNKKIIAIGYSRIREQQHIKVVEALSVISKKSDYFLVFQMSYGDCDENYITDLRKKLDEVGFEYKFFFDYLSMDDLARLRLAVDVFINAQTTDAFCNSIKEYMYTKTQIINAVWLHYPEIDLFPLYINEFSDFSEISDLLSKPLSDGQLVQNKKKIKDETAWKACRNKWRKIYGA